MAEGGRITRPPSGFGEHFLNAVEEDLQCSICYLPLKEPVLTRCGHRFCKECLGEHFRRSVRDILVEYIYSSSLKCDFSSAAVWFRDLWETFQ